MKKLSLLAAVTLGALGSAVEDGQLPDAPLWTDPKEREKSCRFVFSYGSNNISQLAERTGSDYAYLKQRARAAHVEGYVRAFAGTSKKWDMASPATIVPSEQGSVNGVALCLTDDEVAKVDVFEGVPLTYRQEEIDI